MNLLSLIKINNFEVYLYFWGCNDYPEGFAAPECITILKLYNFYEFFKKRLKNFSDYVDSYIKG
ncbi:hypothetical protein EBX93_02325 [bacterium]|nr:hypothetical protein [bacterium]